MHLSAEWLCFYFLLIRACLAFQDPFSLFPKEVKVPPGPKEIGTSVSVRTHSSCDENRSNQLNHFLFAQQFYRLYSMAVAQRAAILSRYSNGPPDSCIPESDRTIWHKIFHRFSLRTDDNCELYYQAISTTPISSIHSGRPA
ncbi:unnamed protein product [Protopolystoma xenopodis]|uniref:Sema domain-containing protein n=1 Tax=Protopolystoma xenopodis TaxID=117903 RepID=A0A448X257_9PLAT|nr:unnamed protein product [Protopolystoma xenopodis]